MITRQEHLEWCKQRAIEYVKLGQIENAFLSFISDIGKHPETANNPILLALGLQLQLAGHLSTADEMTKWINGFN